MPVNYEGTALGSLLFNQIHVTTVVNLRKVKLNE